ncbi:MAG: RNA-guided endonuclease TnpB family protein [Nitrososphaeraceae archaeon]
MASLLSIRCRLYPTMMQEERLLETLETCRNLYNHFLFESRLSYKEGYKINHYEMSAIIPMLTKGKEIYSKVTQPVIDQFYRNISVLNALNKKGIKIGKLRFKPKDRFKSFTYNQSGFHILHDTSELNLSKIGKIRIVLHRRIEGLIKEIHIKKEQSGKWLANIVVAPSRKSVTHTAEVINKPVGLDVGIKNFAYDSDGHVVEHPTILNKSSRKLVKRQRILSRRQLGSNNRNKQRVKVARTHETIANQRNDFLHKLSRQYVNKHDAIFVEDLHIDNMVKNKHLSKSILDSSWSEFFRMLQYKAASAGIAFHKVLPFGTSQNCSKCGKVVKKTLAIRIHRCPYCGLEIDRDHNASINILRKGMKDILKLPMEPREFTPLEIEPIHTIY